jgi:hypothetical protein
LVFQHAISAAIEIRVLRKMVECLSWAVEAWRDIVSTVVVCAALGAPGTSLRAAGAARGLAKREVTADFPETVFLVKTPNVPIR